MTIHRHEGLRAKLFQGWNLLPGNQQRPQEVTGPGEETKVWVGRLGQSQARPGFPSFPVFSQAIYCAAMGMGIKLLI